MSDFQYEDVFVEGDDLMSLENIDKPTPYRSIVIYRYYDEASKDFGSGNTPPIEHFAKGLSDLILRLRGKVCANPDNKTNESDFRVYLVAHSMGGLVCRAFLQNPELGDANARACVDKVFTYASPHNGIDLRIVRNVPGWITFGDVNNFNRERMAKYLGYPKQEDVDVSAITNFPADRVFNLVGTNPNDYTAVGGLSAWAAGEASDGLVRIENATTRGTDTTGRAITSPRAFVYRSHSGAYGIVNSEEGFQNLTRFLFGQLRVDGILEIDDITLPTELQRKLKGGQEVRASYQFEVAVSLRGCQWQLTRREVRENSAIFRSYEDLFPVTDSSHRPPNREKSPHLFSIFLDKNKSVKSSKSVSFACDLNLLVPDYTVDGSFFSKRHYEGGYILREQILFEAFPDESSPIGWKAKYGFQSKNPGKAGISVDLEKLSEDDSSTTLGFRIPITQKNQNPGFHGALRIEIRPWA